MIEEYCVRRDLMVAAINEIPGVYCHRPQGTFYTFVNVVGTGMRSEEFSELLLDQLGVATCPGNYFGQTGEGYVRFCFARSTREIERAAERLKSIKLK